MTDLTGGVVRPVVLTAGARATTSAVPGTPRTAADMRAALARLPVANLRKGYRQEPVERLVERVARELERREQGMAPFLRAADVHPDGFAQTRPGYSIEATRELLAAAAAALRT